MDEFEYNGYVIVENSDGNYQIDDFEFPTLREAMEWVDDMNVATFTGTKPVSEPKMHTYLFFYVDKATDQSFEAKVLAKDLSEAKKILRQNYDVYTIADYTILD